MDPGAMDEEEMKRLRRDAAIRAREQDFKRQQEEKEEAKKNELERLKQEYAMREERRLEERLALLRKQAEVRAQKQAEADRLVRKRNAAIEKREQSWKERANSKIQTILDEKEEEDMRIADNQQKARDRKAETEDKQHRAKLEEHGRLWQLDQKRQQNILAKEAVRRQKDMMRVDTLKAEAHEELQSFIENPFPVPLKQVLAGRIRPVPGVSELLSVYKDQREMLKELGQRDVSMVAVLNNQNLFQCVRDIQMEAEGLNVRPPEPPGTKKEAKSSTAKKTRR
jgi:hypothetical protein